jgi:putative ABC transport system permease protein
LLANEPTFSGLAILALALGIGSNTAIFSMVNGILLRPLPYAQPQQLYLIREVVPMMGKASGSWPANLLNFDMWQHQTHSFEKMAVAEPLAVDTTSTHEPKEIDGARVSATLFDTLGVTPLLGRDFHADEDQPGRDHVIILSNSFWRNEYHEDPSIIGKSISLNGVPHEVVGVLPRSFHFPSGDQLGERVQFGPHTAFFKPLGLSPDQFHLLGNFRFAAIARLKAGVTPEQALADLDVVQARIADQAGSMMGRHMEIHAELIPLEKEVVGSSRRGLLFLLACVTAVLLIVCVNLASLLLARASRRLREAAIRTALGASRGRLIVQSLLEAVPISLFGGLLGIAFAYVGLHWLVASAPVDVPRLDEVHIDVRVFAFACGLMVLTSILFGILPAWRSAKTNPLELIKSGGTTSSVDRTALFLRNSLIGLEVGLTVLLLILAGSLTSSLVRMLNVEKGFDVEGVLTADVALPPQKYGKLPDRLLFYDQVRASVAALPGVRSDAWVSKLPLEGQALILAVNVPDQGQKESENVMANYRYASPNYFQSLGIPLMQGRFFDESDRTRNVNVVLVSQSVAQKVWPKENPIGRQFHPGPNDAPLAQVVGVVGDIKTVSLDQPAVPVVYVPYWQMEMPSRGSLVVRAPVSALGSLATEIRNEIRKADPDVPVLQIRSMGQIVNESVAGRWFEMLLAHLFAGFALFLATLGIYSVVSYAVEQRRYELGIRSALGASATSLRLLVVRQGMWPVCLGLVLGVIGGLLVARAASSLFYGITAADPVIIAAVIVAVALIGLGACYIPALRTSKVSPALALRAE